GFSTRFGKAHQELQPDRHSLGWSRSHPEEFSGRCGARSRRGVRPRFASVSAECEAVQHRLVAGAIQLEDNAAAEKGTRALSTILSSSVEIPLWVENQVRSRAAAVAKAGEGV